MMPMPHTNSHRPIAEVSVSNAAHEVTHADPFATAALVAAALSAAVTAARTRHERAPGGYDTAAYDAELAALVAEAAAGLEGDGRMTA